MSAAALRILAVRPAGGLIAISRSITNSRLPLAWNLLATNHMRVLIADDQRSFGTALADMVRYCGHEVVAIVGSGLEAIQSYTLHQPDLVLMDNRMPKLNGVTASRHIIAKNPDARVILVSAWSPLDGADESHAMCYLPKPVDLARLNATLQKVASTLPATFLPVAEIDYPPETIDYFQPIIEPALFIPFVEPSLETNLPFQPDAEQPAAANAIPTPISSVKEKKPRTKNRRRGHKRTQTS